MKSSEYDYGGDQHIRVSGSEYQVVRKSGLNITVLNQCKSVSKRILNLKKQSQFVPGLIGVTSYLKGDYDKYPLCGARKNKAKQSQFSVVLWVGG